MKFTKKFMSVLLAVVLVIGTLSVSAFAWTGAGNQQLKFVVIPDKTNVSAGDTVSFDIVMEVAENSSFSTFQNFTISFMFNKNVLTPTDYSYGPIISEFTRDRGFAVVTNATNLNKVKTGSTAEEQALWEANGYNAMLTFQCTKDASTSLGSQGYWELAPGENTVLGTITCTVADDAPDGTPICFDYISGIAAANKWIISTIDTANNNKATAQAKATFFDNTEVLPSTTTIVGEAVTPATPLTVVKWKDQVKFDTNKDGSYAGKFSYRTLAELDNFYEIFDDVADAVDTADGDGILDAGFVFNKGAALDAAAAKAQVEGGDAVYTQTQNTYLSTTMKDGSVVMACVVYGITDADAATVLSTLAYVKYMQDGEVKYAYYDVETGTFEGLYNEHYSEAFAG